MSPPSSSYYTPPAPQGQLDPSLKKRIGYVSENEFTPEDRCYVMGLAAARVPTETIYKECGVPPAIVSKILDRARKDPQEYQGGLEALRPRRGGDYEASLDAIWLS